MLHRKPIGVSVTSEPLSETVYETTEQASYLVRGKMVPFLQKKVI